MFKNIIKTLGWKQQEAIPLPINLVELENKIRFTFRNKNLALQALKHRSYLSLSNEDDIASNERLEFLGDAVLELIVTEHLYSNFGSESEGNLSKKKSVLVSREALAQVINELDLGKYLLINRGEEKTGGRRRQSNLANLFEALLGAIYLDGGYQKAKEFAVKFLLSRRDEILTKSSYFNYKSSLLEYSQSKGWGSPVYKVEEESGPDHRKLFVVSVKVNDNFVGKGKGMSKKRAEQLAAKNLIKQLDENFEETV
jgi:ribonuclease-3